MGAFPTGSKIHVYSNALAAYQSNSAWKTYNLTDDFDNPAAGQLSTIVGTNPTALKVSGDLNGTDIKYLRSLIKDHQLTSLDLSDARIVAGGEAYDGEQYVENNTMGNEMFACSNLQSIVLPSTLQRMRYCCLGGTQLLIYSNNCPRILASSRSPMPPSQPIVRPISGRTSRPSPASRVGPRR